MNCDPEEEATELEDATGTSIEFEDAGREASELEEMPGRTSVLDEISVGGTASELELATRFASKLEDEATGALTKFAVAFSSEHAVISTTATIGRIIFFIIDLLISFLQDTFCFLDSVYIANEILKLTVSAVFYKNSY